MYNNKCVQSLEIQLNQREIGQKNPNTFMWYIIKINTCYRGIVKPVSHPLIVYIYPPPQENGKLICYCI